MPIISDGNNQIGDEITDEHTVLGKTFHTGSYYISSSDGNNILVDTDEMSIQVSMAPGGAYASTSPQIGVFNDSGQPSIAVYRADDTKNIGGGIQLFRKSSTGSVGSGDSLGSIVAHGHDGTDFNTAAQIRFAVTGTVETDKLPTKIEFLTNPGSATTVFPATRMTIESNGNVGIGTSGQSDKLTVNGSGKVEGDLKVQASSGDVSLIVEGTENVKLGLVADTDNAGGEDQNPRLYMSQETATPGAYQFLMGLEGTAGLTYTGSYTNQPFILALDSETHNSLRTFQIATSDGGDVSSRFSIANGGKIAIGDGVQSASARLHISERSTDDVLLLETTENSSTASPVLKLKRNSASPADDDYIGQLEFSGENDQNQEVEYAKITGKISDASDGTEDGILEFTNIKAGSQTVTARLRHDSFQLLNSTNLSVNGTTTLEGAVSFPDVLITELSIPNIDLQTNTNAFRFNCPYGLTVTGLRLHLDQHTTSGDVTVTVTNSTDNNTMITLSITGTNLSANTTTVSNASADQGDIITFAITATPANAQGLRATLEFKRDV